MKATRRLAAAEFEAVRPLLTHLAAPRIAAARSVLVDGQSMQAVATAHGWAARSTVLDCVDAVWKVLSAYREAQAAEARAGVLLPPGWEQVTLVAPSALIARFRNEIAAAAGVPPASVPAPAMAERKRGAGKSSKELKPAR